MTEDACCEGQKICCSKGLEIVETKCSNCRKPIYVFRNCLRDNMFCTMKCMEGYREKDDNVKPINEKPINEKPINE